MYVELMNEETANLIATFATEAEALAFVRAAIEQHGRAYVYTWALGYSDDNLPTLSGAALVRWRAARTGVCAAG